MTGPAFSSRREAIEFGVLCLSALGLVGGAIAFGADSLATVARSAKHHGEVVALVRERGFRGMTRDHPVVRYVDRNTGIAHEFKSSFGLRPSPFAVGDQVVVAVDPEARRAPVIVSFWSLGLLPLALAFVGACATFAAWLMLRRRESRRPEP